MNFVKTTSGNIRMIDMPFLDSIFEMEGGYVLNFSDRTFAQFFANEINVDINDAVFAQTGTSKAKRLRHFLQIVDKQIAIAALNALWEYREELRKNSQTEEKVPNAYGRFVELTQRIEGGFQSKSVASQTHPIAFNRPKLQKVKSELLALQAISPQQRGFAFEKLLKQFFDIYELAANPSFRLVGEQIDGSFELANEIYLLEAKWQSPQTGVADLHTFHGKIEQKAAWTRGLFISISGFTDEGLVAFGKAKRVICMDGLDLDDMLRREIPLNHVLDRKVRRAAETGHPFARVRDLFPE